MAMPKTVKDVLYLCDGKACGGECPSANLCHHTTKWEHALHKDADVSGFDKVPIGENELLLVELYDGD